MRLWILACLYCTPRLRVGILAMVSKLTQKEWGDLPVPVFVTVTAFAVLKTSHGELEIHLFSLGTLALGIAVISLVIAYISRYQNTT